jgi:hypothetical protein
MSSSKTRAILKVLARGREEKLANTVMKIFGASSIDECLATYEMLGAAERSSLDEALARMTANASAAFLLGVENVELADDQESSLRHRGA